MKHNLILCGFMGCGKSTVGRRLAQRWQRPLWDTDEVIAFETGRSPAAWFTEEGETAFRAQEAQLCRRLSVPQGLIVATGGGTVMAPENVSALRRGGVIVHLYVPAEIALARLAGMADRPLLAEGEARMRERYAERLPQYRAASHVEVDAVGTPEEIALRVEAALTSVGLSADFSPENFT